MAGIELVEDKATARSYDPARKTGWRVAVAALSRGVLIRPLGDVVVLMPPVGISREDLGELARATYASIKEVTEGE